MQKIEYSSYVYLTNGFAKTLVLKAYLFFNQKMSTIWILHKKTCEKIIANLVLNLDCSCPKNVFRGFNY